MRRTICALALSALASVTMISVAAAQASPTAYAIPRGILAQAQAETGDGYLAILVSGQNCGQVYFGSQAAGYTYDAADRFIVRLDSSTLSSECSRDGLPIVLVRDDGRVLAARNVVASGQTVVLESGSVTPPVPGGNTELVVNLGALADTPREAAESVVVTAAGKECGSVSLYSPLVTNDDGDAVLRLDAAGVPAECSRDGQELIITTNRGFKLFQRPVVVREGTTMLISFAPEPPSTSGQPVPLPPNTGTAGPLQSDGHDHALFLAGGAIALAVITGLGAFQRRPVR